MTTAEAIAKARKLLRLAQSSNVHESALAAARAQEIMDRHHIAQSMLAESEEREADEPIAESGTKMESGPRIIRRWKRQLADRVARHNHCRVYISGSRSLIIVGRETDAQTARDLYGYLVDEVTRLLARDGAGRDRTWRNNYCLGAVTEIATMLYQQREAMKSAIKAESADSRALVVTTALQRFEQRGRTVDAWVEEHLHLRKDHSPRARADYAAFAAGRVAAKSINLGGARRRLAPDGSF